MEKFTSAEFSERTQIPRQTLRRWKFEGKLIPSVNQGKGKPSYYDETQIPVAIALRESLHKKKPATDNGLTDLFDDDTDTVKDVQHVDDNQDKLENVSEFEPADEQENFSAETSTVENPDTPAQDVVIDVPAVVITPDERANRIRQHMRNICSSVIEIGRELIAAKKEIGHGGWTEWLQKEFEWSQDTATNYMKVAVRFGEANSETFRNLKPSTLIKMLSLPAGEEQDFIDEQKKIGKPIETQSARQVQAAVKKWNQDRIADNPVARLNQLKAEKARLEKSFDEPTVDDVHRYNSVTAEISQIHADIAAQNFAKSPNTDTDEFKPSISMRADVQQVLADIGELIQTADADNLADAFKVLSAVRDNLRGRTEKNFVHK